MNVCAFVDFALVLEGVPEEAASATSGMFSEATLTDAVEALVASAVRHEPWLAEADARVYYAAVAEPFAVAECCDEAAAITEEMVDTFLVEECGPLTCPLTPTARPAWRRRQMSEISILRNFFFHFYPDREEGVVLILGADAKFAILDSLGAGLDDPPAKRLTTWRARRERRASTYDIIRFDVLDSRITATASRFGFIRTRRSVQNEI